MLVAQHLSCRKGEGQRGGVRSLVNNHSPSFAITEFNAILTIPSKGSRYTGLLRVAVLDTTLVRISRSTITMRRRRESTEKD